MSRGSLRLRIGRLVLDGVAAPDPERLGRALEVELARLLEREGAGSGLDRGAAIERLDAGEISWSAGSSAEALGASLAGAVYSLLGGKRP